MIGKSNYFGFGFTTLFQKLLYFVVSLERTSKCCDCYNFKLGKFFVFWDKTKRTILALGKQNVSKFKLNNFSPTRNAPRTSREKKPNNFIKQRTSTNQFQAIFQETGEK